MSNAAKTSQTIPKTRIDLLESEKSFITFDLLPATTSVTFFDGTPPIDYLRQRTREIVEANPWVAAKPSKEGGINHMVYPEKTADLPELFQTFDASTDVAFAGIDMSRSYGEICRAAVPLMIKIGSEVTEEDKGSFLVSVITNLPQQTFALVVSLSHVVGDGHTFYTLHNMLSVNATVEALEPKRDESFPEKQNKLMGEAMAKGVTDVPLTLRSLMGVLKLKLFTKRQVQQLYYVDDDYIQDQKKAYQQKKKNNENENENEPAFISTNDVLTSWFNSHIKTKFSLMAINLRNRIEGITDKHAGNYENFMAFQHDDSRDPALIRKAVQSCGRDKVYPGVWKRMWSTPFAVITNWTTFDKGIDLPNAEQRLHLPLYLDDSLHADVNMCFIFRPKRGQIGMLFMSDHGIPVSDAGSSPVGKAMFTNSRKVLG